jgi:Flp pilus assembly protein protease CpaA
MSIRGMFPSIPEGFGRPHGRWLAWLLALVAPLVLGLPWVAVVGRLDGGLGLGTLSGLIVFLLLAVCSWTDLKWGKIPNWATYVALLWAFALNAAWRCIPDPIWPTYVLDALGAVGLGESLGGAIVCFVPMLLLHSMAGGGAGDAKLAAAIGALLGARGGVRVLIAGYIIAGLVVLARVVWTLGLMTLVLGFARRLASIFLPGLVAGPSPDQERILSSPIRLAAFFALGALVEASEPFLR